MPTFIYTNDIPDANNNPSTDQPDMKVNTNSIDSLINVDHYSFQESGFDGTHRQVQLRQAAGGNGTIPAGLQGAGWESLYSSVTGGVGDLWFVRGATATGVRLTGPGTPSALVDGYTFLPGGILVQWGFENLGAGITTFLVTYPIAFPNNVFYITGQPYSNNISRLNGVSYCTDGSSSLTQFTFNLTSNANNIPSFGWMAIGN